jgi:hypothetical protein
MTIQALNLLPSWIKVSKVQMASLLLLGMGILGSAFAFNLKSVHIEGQVQAGGGPVAGSSVTLWAASAGPPTQLAHARTGPDGRFTIADSRPVGGDAILYIVAKGGEAAVRKGRGDNPAIGFLSVLGSTPPSNVVINEMTTVASVWTDAQFLDGEAIKGHALGLRVAAGNVPSFVDLRTGGWGSTIQDPLNSAQTPTMANFATLADALSGCATKVTADACQRLFAAATPPKGAVPTDTLTAAESIARYPWYRPERLFALLDQFYPVPRGRNLRPAPFIPYLSFSPSAWVLPLKFDGGGYRAGGGAMFDSEGNLWIGNNFTVGWQGQDVLWQGNATKFDPNGRPLSPITTGFAGGGLQGASFGAAVDAKDHFWVSSYGGRSIAVFDKTGRPLTPPDGVTFNGRLGLMQGIISTPSGDVWALGVSKRQLVYFPKGDWTRGKILCEGDSGEPCKSFLGPFALAIDQKNRIWVSNADDHVTRFLASDPTRAEKFKTGFNNSGINVDSQGNVWISNRFGSGLPGMAHLVEMALRLKFQGLEPATEFLTRTMSKQKSGDGSVTLLRPDGTQFPGSPFKGGGLPGPWAVVVDGNDNVWVSNFAMPSSPIVQLCGVRTETCPPGFKTGDQISPPGGYVGGGLQMQVDLAISPAGDIWVTNNWQDIGSCYGKPNEATSTRCGGQGVTVFFGMAKPVRTPQIGPAQAAQATDPGPPRQPAPAAPVPN